VLSSKNAGFEILITSNLNIIYLSLLKETFSLLCGLERCVVIPHDKRLCRKNAGLQTVTQTAPFYTLHPMYM
jgi:hypothetical protein